LSDNLEPLDPFVRVLVEAEKARPEPPTSIGDRIINRVAMTLVLDPSGVSKTVSTDGNGPRELSPDPSAAFPSAAAAGSGGSASATFVLSRGWGATLIFLGGLTAGAVGHGVVERVMEQKPPPRVAAPVALAPPPATPFPPSGPVLEPRSERPKEPAPAGIEKSPVRQVARIAPAPVPRTRLEPGGKLAAERNLIEIARTALGRGRYDEALKSLRRHATQFADGELEEEREGLMVLALIGHGDGAEARASGQRFLQRFPRSLFAQAVETALRSIP